MVLRRLFSEETAKKKQVLLHICIWFVLIVYEVSFVYITTGRLQKFTDYLYAYLLNILLFYTNVWCLSYSFLIRKKKYLYFFLFLTQILTYLALHYCISNMEKGWKITLSVYFTKVQVLLFTYRAIYFMAAGTGYWFVLLLLRSNNLINKMQNRHLMQQKQSAELERNLFKAKNAFLTSQINPHLLFNTLNFIYSSMYEVSKKAAEVVILLSDMMRYSLTEIGEDGQVELYKEIEHIENMIQLNQARFNDNLNIKLNLDGDFEVRVIPLVFLTFVENIFKHGDMSDPQMPAQINISCIDNTLEFYCTNKMRKVNTTSGTGIGIENSKTRLDIAYPGKYQLISAVVDDQYTTRLTINLN